MYSPPTPGVGVFLDAQSLATMKERFPFVDPSKLRKVVIHPAVTDKQREAYSPIIGSKAKVTVTGVAYSVRGSAILTDVDLGGGKLESAVLPATLFDASEGKKDGVGDAATLLKVMQEKGVMANRTYKGVIKGEGLPATYATYLTLDPIVVEGTLCTDDTYDSKTRTYKPEGGVTYYAEPLPNNVPSNFPCVPELEKLTNCRHVTEATGQNVMECLDAKEGLTACETEHTAFMNAWAKTVLDINEKLQ